jgi:uncharacterized protein
VNIKMADDNKKQGWTGDPQGHAAAGAQSSGNPNAADNLTDEDRSKGGQMSSGNFKNDPQRASEAGQKGGKAAQDSGNAHEFTEEERSEGGSSSGGNFANDPQRASEAGRKGGSR